MAGHEGHNVKGFAAHAVQVYPAYDAACEEKLKEFETFFIELGNGPLARPERAILKTFLVWQALPEKDKEGVAGEAPATEVSGG